MIARFSSRTPLSSKKQKESPSKTRDEKIDAQVADSFPASDPPSFSGGTHIIGAPEGRKSHGASQARKI